MFLTVALIVGSLAVAELLVTAAVAVARNRRDRRMEEIRRDLEEMDGHLKISDLIEARERADAGLRLAFPQLVESLTPQLPAPELTTEDANAIGYRMGNARADLIEAMKVADVCGERELHMRLADLVNQVDELAGMLSVLAGLVEGRS
jgi:hypothetical protein